MLGSISLDANMHSCYVLTKKKTHKIWQFYIFTIVLRVIIYIFWYNFRHVDSGCPSKKRTRNKDCWRKYRPKVVRASQVNRTYMFIQWLLRLHFSRFWRFTQPKYWHIIKGILRLQTKIKLFKKFLLNAYLSQIVISLKVPMQ